jgi:hypothetical protein
MGAAAYDPQGNDNEAATISTPANPQLHVIVGSLTRRFRFVLSRKRRS